MSNLRQRNNTANSNTNGSVDKSNIPATSVPSVISQFSISFSDLIFSSAAAASFYGLYFLTSTPRDYLIPPFPKAFPFNNPIPFTNLLQIAAIGYVLMAFAAGMGIFRFAGLKSFVSIHDYSAGLAGAVALWLISAPYLFQVNHRLIEEIPPDSLFSCMIMGSLFLYNLFRTFFRAKLLAVYGGILNAQAVISIMYVSVNLLLHSDVEKLRSGAQLSLTALFGIIMAVLVGAKAVIKVTPAISVHSANIFHYFMAISVAVLCAAQNQLFSE
jgi:hypothetical protein